MRGWESGTWGFLSVCLWASHMTVLGSVSPRAINQRARGGFLCLLEAVNPQPGIPIRSANVSFLFKRKVAYFNKKIRNTYNTKLKYIKPI